MIVNKRLYKMLLHLANELLPMLFWVLLLFGFDKPYIAIITILSALLHETGHYAAILATKCDTGTPVGHFSGFRIRERRVTSYCEEIAILLAGPLANFGVFLLLIPFLARGGYLATFSLINLATAISNLLPIKGYDGHSALREFARMRGWEHFVTVLDSISFILCSLFATVALYLMYRHDAGYWIYGIFMASILSEMRKRLRDDVF